MKPMTILGIMLIVLGALALAYQGISYSTTETVAQLGPLEVKAEKRETLPLPPILGGLAVAGGIFLVWTAGRR